MAKITPRANRPSRVLIPPPEPNAIPGKDYRCNQSDMLQYNFAADQTDIARASILKCPASHADVTLPIVLFRHQSGDVGVMSAGARKKPARAGRSHVPDGSEKSLQWVIDYAIDEAVQQERPLTVQLLAPAKDSLSTPGKNAAE